MGENSKASEMRTGLIVLIVLAVLTGAEFAVAAVTDGSLVILGIIAFIKAGLIVQYFMHARRVLNYDDEKGGH